MAAFDSLRRVAVSSMAPALLAALLSAAACSAYQPVGDQPMGAEDDGEGSSGSSKRDAGAKKKKTSTTTEDPTPGPDPVETVAVAPRITTMNPATAIAGSRGVAITIFGVGFAADSKVEVDGVAMGATLEASGSLRGTLPDAKLATSGSLVIVVKTGALTSPPSSFVVSSAQAATLSSLAPTTAPTRQDNTTVPLTVSGSGFVSTSQIVFGGRALPTNFTSTTSLSATIPSDMLITATTHAVTVRDGAIRPLSGALNFRVTLAPTGTAGTGGNPASGCGANNSRTSCLNAGCGWVVENGPCIDPNGPNIGDFSGGGGDLCSGNGQRTTCLNNGCGWIEPNGPCIQ